MIYGTFFEATHILDRTCILSIVTRMLQPITCKCTYYVVKHSIACAIRKTCPCNEYPLKPHFYIVKVGYAGVYLFFLFLLQNIDCRYSLGPPRRGGSNVYSQSMS